MTTELIGPLYSGEQYDVVVDGYKVPYIQLHKDANGSWLTLDRRFQVKVDKKEMDSMVWFLANSMAVAAGYSCHGENCQPANPFKVQVGSLQPDPPPLKIV